MLGREFLAFGGACEGWHCGTGENVFVALYVLRGDLESVEKKAGSARIELGGGQAVEDLGEGDLDGATIFEDRNLDGLVSAGSFLCGRPMQRRVEVAVGCAAE